MGQVRPAEVRRFPCVNSPIKRLNRGISMKKSKTVKMLVLAMALIMVFSVSASAASSIRWAQNGYTARGSVGVKSAHTEYDTVGSNIYAHITYVYYTNYSSGEQHRTYGQTNNAGTSATAYTTEKSEHSGQTIIHINSFGSHSVNGGSNYSTTYY